jgi:hypothetical protein
MEVPQPGLSAKLAVLWATKKPLVIGVIVGLILLVLAIIFLILFFTVLRPGAASGPTPVAVKA